ncbi:MAG TPA: radical SAM protein, partial [Myxococcota bacterium]|nr:radical SAM protein [Myxococcota bacterium]
MSWLERLAGIEELEDAELDAALIAQFERAAPRAAGRPIRFSTPTFKSYSSCDMEACGKNSFPAFSVTAGACALDCDHC